MNRSQQSEQEDIDQEEPMHPGMRRHDNDTDITRTNLNITQISQNYLNDKGNQDSQPPSFNDNKRNDNLLASQTLNLRKDKRVENAGGVNASEYMSKVMIDLESCLNPPLDEDKFREILSVDVLDNQEVLMILYCAVECFNSEQAFDIIVKRNNYFKVNPQWNQIFETNGIFSLLQQHGTKERRQFDIIAMATSIDKDLHFMTELIIFRSRMTKELLQILLSNDRWKLVIQQISNAKRPFYIDDNNSINTRLKGIRGFQEQVERELHFNDIIYAALDMKLKSNQIIQIVKMMKEEIKAHKNLFDQPDKEFNLNDLFRIFVQRRKIKLLRYLFSLLNEFNFKSQHFIEALELEAYDMAALLYKEFFRILRDSQADNEYIITILISSLNKHNGQMDFKAFLIRSYLEQFILRHANHFLDTLAQKILQENKFNILVLNFNIVKTSCLLIEILEQITVRFDQLRVRCQTLRKKIERIAKLYMNSVESEKEMRYLLLEKDFEDRDSLDLITSYKITAFLESKFADNVVKEIWRSPYSTNDQIFSASTNHRLTFQFWHCVKDDETTNRFYHSKDITKFEAHPLQFTVWRYSAKSRIIVEFTATIMLAIAVHIFINFVLKESPTVQTKMSSFLQVEATMKSIIDKTSTEYIKAENNYFAALSLIKVDAQSFFDKVMIVSYISFLPLFYAIQHMLNIIYASINKRQIDPYNFLNMLDLGIFTIFITNIIITYARNLDGTWLEYPYVANETRATIYARNYMRGQYLSEDALWICCIVIMWVRVFYFLRFNEFMGKFIGVVERILYEVALFFGFYILQLIFFAIIANLCFRTLGSYNNLWYAFKTLFYASLGQFSFDEISQASQGPYFGITFMIIFQVCNIGIVINMFIAVITIEYERYSHNKNIYQMLETLKLRAQTQADKEYSSLISLPPPLNCLHVIFAPFLLTSKNPRCLNEFILSIGYIPVMFGALFIFILYNIVLLPACFVKLWWHKLIMIYVYSKSYRVSRADKFMTFCMYLIFGLPILILNSITDIYHFVRHLWLKDLVKTKHKTGEQQLSKYVLDSFCNYFKSKSEKVLPYRTVATDLRSNLGLIEQIITLLKPKALIRFMMQGENNNDAKTNDQNLNKIDYDNQKVVTDEKHIDFMHHSIRQYSTLKQILERNSDFQFTDESQRMKTVDCKIMHTMLQDLLRYKTVFKVVDEDFIFIRRAYNAKSLREKELKKQKSVSEENQNSYAHHSAQMESEETKESKIRQKILFRKILFLNTKRIINLLKNLQTYEDLKIKQKLLN